MAERQVQIHIADLPKFKALLGAVAGLLRALADCRDLPEPVMAAADEVRKALADLGGRDIGPRP
jgi:hypothetical protein